MQNTPTINEARFYNTCQYYKVSSVFSQHLRKLVDYKLILICDDSGSMKKETQYGETRWQELNRFVQQVFSITECIDNNHLDIHFLNRGSLIGVQELSQITGYFQMPPKGPTPLVPILRMILSQTYGKGDDYKGRIVLIATDGVPTDKKGHSDVDELYKCLSTERDDQDYISFLACTDDEKAIGYLNNWDVVLKNVDVMDDYQSEMKEVLAAKGKYFTFSYSDYVVKTLLGSVIRELDKLDERTTKCRCILF